MLQNIIGKVSEFSASRCKRRGIRREKPAAMPLQEGIKYIYDFRGPWV
jgi:hypothetical protein